jgi:hypothetical protein
MMSPTGIQELHVAEKLGLVYRENILNRLCFHEDTAFHQHVETQGFLPSKFLVFDYHRLLAYTFKPRNPSSLIKHHS